MSLDSIDLMVRRLLKTMTPDDVLQGYNMTVIKLVGGIVYSYLRQFRTSIIKKSIYINSVSTTGSCHLQHSPYTVRYPDVILLYFGDSYKLQLRQITREPISILFYTYVPRTYLTKECSPLLIKLRNSNTFSRKK